MKKALLCLPVILLLAGCEYAHPQQGIEYKVYQSGQPTNIVPPRDGYYYLNPYPGK